MKKLIILIIIAVFATAAYAAPPYTLLSSVTATGSGAATSLADSYKDFTCQANITGAPTAVSVCLDGNLSGSRYSEMGCHDFTAGELAATQAVFSILGMPANSIQGRLKTLTNGSSPTVTLICTGVK